jgi:hypothetical protein
VATEAEVRTFARELIYRIHLLQHPGPNGWLRCDHNLCVHARLLLNEGAAADG